MEIKTGKGTVAFIVLLGIWSVSALTSLPGLALSPVLGKLSSVFTHVSDVELQLLTSLPSLFIIPFILISGWLIEHVGHIKLLYAGLWLFFACGVLYFFCSAMWQLIAVSVILGIGAGIIVPLSTALISHFFSGEYRTAQYGYSSAINNMTLVIATLLTGYLAEINWKLSFAVYLLPIFSILTAPYIARAETNIPAESLLASHVNAPVQQVTKWKEIRLYMAYYFLITYLTVIISFNLSFLLEEYSYTSSRSGIIISLFFLSIMLPGFFISSVLKLIKKEVELICLFIIGTGLFFIYMYSSLPVIAFGCIVTGLGYGIAQPYIYDKVSSLATPEKNGLALALVMAMNYVAIFLSPFIVDFMQNVTHVASERFAFGLNVVIAVLAFVAILIRRVIMICRKGN